MVRDRKESPKDCSRTQRSRAKIETALKRVKIREKVMRREGEGRKRREREVKRGCRRELTNWVTSN